jgi:hypothetical protein
VGLWPLYRVWTHLADRDRHRYGGRRPAPHPQDSSLVDGGEHAIRTRVDLPSDPPILKASHHESLPDAVLLGYLTDSGEPLWLPTLGDTKRPEDPPNDHMMILGMSGVGKTVAASEMMLQQIRAGGGVIFADGKIDSDNISMLWQMLRWTGREDDLVVIHPGDPSLSNTLQPHSLW